MSEKSSPGLENVKILDGRVGPNQIALDLLNEIEDVQHAIILTRDLEGRLSVVWTDQDLADLAEAALHFQALVQQAIYHDHESEDDEE